MTFLEAYALYGPDVERIAVSMRIKPHEADRLINEEMDRRRAMVPFVGFDPTEKSWWGK